MNKFLYFFTASLITATVIFTACKHEFDPCDGNPLQLQLTATAASLGQNDGTITAHASGGTGFQFSIDNGANFQTDSVFTNLVGNQSYSILVKNSKGCSATDTITVGKSADPCSGVNISISITKTDPTTGLSDGSITAVASGSTGFTYSLNGGVYQSSGAFTSLAAGVYTVTVKNADGCAKSDTVTLGPDPCSNVNIQITDSVVNVLPCPSTPGKIIVTASGSSGYLYSKDGINFQTSNTFTNIAAGNYTITVKDANGCTNTKPVSVGTKAKGPLFTDVRTLITARCGGPNPGCHMNGYAAKGFNFDNDCSIITNKSRIISECVNSNNMPISPQSALSTAEKDKIRNWNTAGGKYTD